MGQYIEFIPHIPRYYIGGVYIPQHDVWIGEFAATTEDLISFSSHELIGYPELELLECMMDTQQIYENWWRRTVKSS